MPGTNKIKRISPENLGLILTNWFRDFNDVSDEIYENLRGLDGRIDALEAGSVNAYVDNGTLHLGGGN